MLKGFTGTDAGRAVEVSRRIATLPEPAADVPLGGAKLTRLNRLEKLDAEWARNLSVIGISENGKINVAEIPAHRRIARYGSERTLCRVGVCVWIDP